jgi:HEAT repeat protein
MKSLCKFAKWSLVGLSIIYILGAYGQILPIAVFLAAIAIMLPPTEPLLVQKFPFLEKGIFKFIAWLMLVTIGFHLVTTPAEKSAYAKEKISRLESQKNVKELIAIVQQKDERSPYAAEALGNLGDKQAVEPLITTLKTATQADIRRNCAKALGKLQDPRAVPILFANLSDMDGEVKESAKEALRELAAKDPKIAQLESQKNVKELIAILQQNDYRSPYVAEVLGNLGDKQAVEPLITALKTATQTDTRRASVEALGKLQDSRAVKPLIDSLSQADGSVKESVKRVLKQLAAKEPSVVDLLLPAFKKGDDTAKDVLVSIGDPAVDSLITALKDTETRSDAAEALGQIGNPRAIKPLVTNLTDWEFGPKAAAALNKLNWKPESDPDKIHLWIALRKGDELRNNWSTTKQVLLNDVRSGNSPKIKYGLHSFVSIGEREILPTLIELLNQRGSVTMVNAYLNCGEPTLEKAARDWAEARGYRIIQTRRNDRTVPWGGM